MLSIDIDLPEGALLGAEARRLAALVTAAGGFWLKPGALEADAGGVALRWPVSAGGGAALPVTPNRGNGRRAAAGGLQLTAGINCGMALADALADCADFTLALLFRPGADEGRTLATVNLQGVKNYLFLTHQDGVLAFKSQSETGEVALPLRAGPAPVLVVAGFSGGRMHLHLGGHLAGQSVVSQTPPDRGIGGPADLFLGCRSQREGLLKTLGEGVILSALICPGNILDTAGGAGAGGAGAALMQALSDWQFWGG